MCYPLIEGIGSQQVQTDALADIEEKGHGVPGPQMCFSAHLGNSLSPQPDTRASQAGRCPSGFTQDESTRLNSHSYRLLNEAYYCPGFHQRLTSLSQGGLTGTHSAIFSNKRQETTSSANVS